ncbi:hypothetical protein C8R43DRAFT_986499 [Mycena crocata]|nr:hypothetical protein C8R43DRAFT_986499 [Mycena crocata]
MNFFIFRAVCSAPLFYLHTHPPLITTTMLSAMLPSSSAGLKSPLASAYTSSVAYTDLAASFVWSAPLDPGSNDTSTAYSRQFASLLPDAAVPRSSDLKSSASPSPVAKRPASHPSDSGSSVSPSQVAQTVFNSSNALLSTPAAVPASASEPRQLKYTGLGHSLPPHSRDSVSYDSYTHLPSIPEDRPLDIYHTPRKLDQRAGLGAPRNSPSPPSPSTSVSAHIPLMKRLQTTIHGLLRTRRLVKRPLFSNSIAEFRSREVSVTQSKVNWKAVPGQQQQRVHTTMSPMMLLAAQSILEEDRKIRKKDGLGKHGASMSRLASQVAREQNC